MFLNNTPGKAKDPSDLSVITIHYASSRNAKNRNGAATMLKQARQLIVNNLWTSYHSISPQIKLIEDSLQKKGTTSLILDHFAIIDLPGPHTGISHLSNIFSSLGYETRGRDYLADKQNDFLWMAEVDSENQPASSVLPQVVVADFRLQEMPRAVRNIIEKYSHAARPSPHSSSSGATSITET